MHSAKCLVTWKVGSFSQLNHTFLTLEQDFYIQHSVRIKDLPSIYQQQLSPDLYSKQSYSNRAFYYEVVKNNFRLYPSMMCSETATEKEEVISMGKTTTGPGCLMQSEQLQHLLASMKLELLQGGASNSCFAYNLHYDLTPEWQEKLHILHKKYLDCTK